jgi:hypothetical protein
MLICMRTTLNIHDELMRQAKRIAADTGSTLTAVVEDALRESFNRRLKQNGATPFVWPTLNLGPPKPGVDLDSSAALLDLMEAGE